MINFVYFRSPSLCSFASLLTFLILSCIYPSLCYLKRAKTYTNLNNNRSFCKTEFAEASLRTTDLKAFIIQMLHWSEVELCSVYWTVVLLFGLMAVQFVSGCWAWTEFKSTKNFTVNAKQYVTFGCTDASSDIYKFLKLTHSFSLIVW